MMWDDKEHCKFAKKNFCFIKEKIMIAEKLELPQPFPPQRLLELREETSARPIICISFAKPTKIKFISHRFSFWSFFINARFSL